MLTGFDHIRQSLIHLMILSASCSLPDLFCVIPKSGINNADFHAGTLTEFMMGKKGKWKEWISVHICKEISLVEM